MPGVVRQNHRDAVTHRRHERICRAEVDADRAPALVRYGRSVGLGDLQQRHQPTSRCLQLGRTRRYRRRLGERTRAHHPRSIHTASVSRRAASRCSILSRARLRLQARRAALICASLASGSGARAGISRRQRGVRLREPSMQVEQRTTATGSRSSEASLTRAETTRPLLLTPRRQAIRMLRFAARERSVTPCPKRKRSGRPKSSMVAEIDHRTNGAARRTRNKAVRR